MTALVHAHDPVPRLCQHGRQETERAACVTHARDTQNERAVIWSGCVIGKSAPRNVKVLNSISVAMVHSRKATMHSQRCQAASAGDARLPHGAGFRLRRDPTTLRELGAHLYASMGR